VKQVRNLGVQCYFWWHTVFWGASQSAIKLLKPAILLAIIHRYRIGNMLSKDMKLNFLLHCRLHFSCLDNCNILSGLYQIQIYFMVTSGDEGTIPVLVIESSPPMATTTYTMAFLLNCCLNYRLYWMAVFVLFIMFIGLLGKMAPVTALACLPTIRFRFCISFHWQCLNVCLGMHHIIIISKICSLDQPLGSLRTANRINRLERPPLTKYAKV